MQISGTHITIGALNIPTGNTRAAQLIYKNAASTDLKKTSELKPASSSSGNAYTVDISSQGQKLSETEFNREQEQEAAAFNRTERQNEAAFNREQLRAKANFQREERQKEATFKKNQQTEATEFQREQQQASAAFKSHQLQNTSGIGEKQET